MIRYNSDIESLGKILSMNDISTLGFSIIQDSHMNKDEIIIVVSPEKYYHINNVLIGFIRNPIDKEDTDVE